MSKIIVKVVLKDPKASLNVTPPLLLTFCRRGKIFEKKTAAAKKGEGKTITRAAFCTTEREENCCKIIEIWRSFLARSVGSG